MSVLKYFGVILLLGGVAVIAVPTLQGGLSNTILSVGLILIVVGYLSHIFLNKKIE